MMVPTVPPLVVIMTREVSDLLSSSSFSPSSWAVIATDALLLSLTKLPPMYVCTNIIKQWSLFITSYIIHNIYIHTVKNSWRDLSEHYLRDTVYSTINLLTNFKITYIDMYVKSLWKVVRTVKTFSLVYNTWNVLQLNREDVQNKNFEFKKE